MESGSPRRSLDSAKIPAGIGSGTLLAVLANNLPDSNPWKSWLLILAPSATAAVIHTWAWGAAVLDRSLARRQVVQSLRQAESLYRIALNDPSTSEQHKADVRREYEKLQAFLLKRFSEINGPTP